MIQGIHSASVSLINSLSNLWTSSSAYKAYGKCGSYLIALYFFVCIFVLLTPLKNDLHNQNINYFLSTQSQVIGTIFGILFSTTMVAVELTRQYSQKLLSDLLGYWTLYYIIPYIIGIISPFFILYYGPSKNTVMASLLVGVFCIFLLVPFALVLRDLLSVDHHINNLSKQGQNAISALGGEDDAEHFTALMSCFQSLRDISTAGVASNDYQVFHLSLSKLEDLSKDASVALSKPSVSDSDTAKFSRFMGYRIADIARAQIEDPRAPFDCVDKLENIAEAGIDNRVLPVVHHSVLTLRKLGQHSARKRLVGDLCVRIARTIYGIGCNALKTYDYGTASVCIRSMRDIIESPDITKVTSYNEIARKISFGCRQMSYHVYSQDFRYRRRKRMLVKSISLIIEIWGDTNDVDVAENFIKSHNFFLRFFGKSRIVDMHESLEEIQTIMPDATSAAKALNSQTVPSDESWPEYVSMVSHIVQNSADLGLIEEADEVLETLENMVENTIDHETSSGILFRFVEPLSYAATACMKADEELGKRALSLAKKVIENAEEHARTAEQNAQILKAIRNLSGNVDQGSQ